MAMSTPPSSKDPFHELRAEVSTQYQDIQRVVQQFHKLTTNSLDRKVLATQVDSECQQVLSQLLFLNEAVDTAAENPSRFSLTAEEIRGRRSWLEATTRQVKGISESIKTMTAATPHVPSAADKIIAANDTHLTSQTQRQEQIIRQQDEQLGDIEKGVENVTAMGKQIHEHLQEEKRLLTQTDDEVGAMSTRLRATTRKMQSIVKKSGSTSQLIVIIVLIAIVSVLAYFVFT